MARTLKLVHVFPPIPTRQFDYMCYDDEEAENPKVVGFGATESEALINYAHDLQDYGEQMEAAALLEDTLAKKQKQDG